MDLVRPLNTNDAQSWATMRTEALQNHPLVFGASMPDDASELIQKFLTRIAEPEAVVFGAFSGNSLNGILGIKRESGLKERHKSFIWGMYVSAVKRRQGFGRMLLNAAIQQAGSWPGVDQVYLTVTDAAGDARRLYEDVGFQAWGRAPRALCWNGECVGETHLTLDLTGMGKCSSDNIPL
jgi:GNAT superfamily N-acetyltransferase